MKLLEYLKNIFEHILVFDYEFSQPDGHNPRPVCLAIKDLVSGKEVSEWLLGREKSFPFPLEKTLLVAHHVVAEASCLLIQNGRELPLYWFDTMLEEQKFYNGLRNSGYSLLASCNRYNIKTGSQENKEHYRDLIINKYPNYSEEEQQQILEYNKSDISINEQLFYKQLERAEALGIDFKEYISQAIFHAKAKAVCAKIENNGIPINMQLLNEIEENYPEVVRLEREEINNICGVELYEGESFKHNKFEEFLKKEGLFFNWPRTEKGKCKTDDKTLYRYQDTNSKIMALRNAFFIIGAKKLKGVCLGPDNRSRCPLKMFNQITGRTNVSTKLNPFGAPRRMRNLIGTDENHYLIYADWRSQEAAIQAALSKDPKMIAAVKSGDPYMYTAIALGAAPKNAKKSTHKKIRNIYKQSFLALAYMQTPIGLQRKLKCSSSEAYYKHEQVSNLYHNYFKWIKGVIAESALRGHFKTIYGWKYYLTSNEVVNPRRLANWPLQSHGSEILRTAIIDLDLAGYEISMPVHDAVLFHMKRKSWREMRRELEGIQKIMSEAAAKVIGAAIPVDIKFIRSQYKQDTENQELWDKLYEKVLKVKGGRNSYQYRTELNSVVDGKAAPVS